MRTTYTEELVWAETADGIEHAGAVWHPADPKPGAPAVVWVHGAGGTFSTPRFVLISRFLAERGFASVVGNNRGHHMGAALVRPGVGEDVLGGVWWEKLSEAHLDVAAWLDKTEELGHPRVVLAGCSYGPVKTVLYQAEHQDPRVVGMVLASMAVDVPRRRRANASVLSLAERMEAEGRGLDLLPWGTIGSGFMTVSARTVNDRARTVTDLYGVEEPEGCAVGKITCPILALCGTEEPEIVDPAELDVIRRNATASSRVDTVVVPGMPHTYRGYEQKVADAIHRWLLELETQRTQAEQAHRFQGYAAV